MRKTTIFLALVLVLAMSGSSFAAGINFDGSLKTNLEWHRDAEGVIETSPSSELGLNFGLNTADEKTRAVVEFGIKDKNEEGLNLDLDPSNFRLEKAYIETDGAFWHGGPEATTRFGNLDVNYGPFSTVKGKYGISVSDMNAGPVSISSFYGIPTEDQKSVQGMHANLGMDNVTAGASIIHDWENLHAVLDGAVRPMDNLLVGGVIATQFDLEAEEDTTEPTAMDLLLAAGAQYQVMDNLSVHGGYKQVSEDWKPAYIADKAKNDQGQNWVHETARNNSGFYAGVVTEQSGILLAADYDQMFEEAILSAATDIEGYNLNVETVLAVNSEDGIKTESTNLGVKKDFAIMRGLDVNAKYNGEWIPGNGLIHTLGATTKLGFVPAIDGLKLNSEVTMADFDTIGYEVGADFKAPNGVELGIKHVGGNYADESIQTGTTAKAGIAVNF